MELPQGRLNLLVKGKEAMDILVFSLLAAILFVGVAQLGGLEKEPVRVRKLKEELDRKGYHLLG